MINRWVGYSDSLQLAGRKKVENFEYKVDFILVILINRENSDVFF